MLPRPSAPVLAALLLSPFAPLFAQEGTGARISTEGPRPPAPRSAEAPRTGPAEGIDDPATLLRLARSTLDAGRLAETADLIERAEVRLLTRSELASEADRPARGGMVGEVAAARAALARRDRADADARLEAAIAALDRDAASAASGASPSRTAPTWGGGAPPAAAATEPPCLPAPVPVPRTAAPKPPPM